MARKSVQQLPEPPLRLKAPAGEIRSRIGDRIEKGRAILEIQIDSKEKLEGARNEYYKWSAYNTEMLKQLFTNNSLAEEYESWIGIGFIQEQSMYQKIKEFHEDVKEKIHRLESISERLELIPLTDAIKQAAEKQIKEVDRSATKIFIVHGHDDAARENTARFISMLGLEPIILHEQANEGMTIIEKLEYHSNVSYAVVLLTPDDEGRKKAEGEILRDRARQNVLLELGYFMSKLGRRRVCALHRGSVEIPTDYLGVLYVPLDEAGGWQLRLAKELKAAGFEVDMNKAV